MRERPLIVPECRQTGAVLLRLAKSENLNHRWARVGRRPPLARSHHALVRRGTNELGRRLELRERPPPTLEAVGSGCAARNAERRSPKWSRLRGPGQEVCRRIRTDRSVEVSQACFPNSPERCRRWRPRSPCDIGLDRSEADCLRVETSHLLGDLVNRVSSAACRGRQAAASQELTRSGGGRLQPRS